MPNASYSGLFHPATILRPRRPWPSWSAVASCLAETTGWMNAVCTVAKTLIRFVFASSPVAHVSVSSTLPWKSVSPPYPIQRASEIRSPAVPDPTGALQQEFDTAFVGKLRQPDVVVPGIDPALGNFRDRHSARAVRREEAQLQFVVVQNGRLFSAHETSKQPGCRILLN